MTGIVMRLQGKKTWTAAAVLVALAVVLVARGDGSLAVGALAIALGLVGVRDNANRKAELLAKSIEDLRAAVGTHNFGPLIGDAGELVNGFEEIPLTPLRDSNSEIAPVAPSTAAAIAAIDARQEGEK
jgi:hypothetical protein